MGTKSGGVAADTAKRVYIMHMIDMSNNRENMAFVGKTPWHGLGQRLKGGESIDQWRIAAGLNYEVHSSPVEFDVGGIANRVMPNRVALYRSDNGNGLSVVSNRYRVFQPGECLEFFRDLVGATGDYELETAGALAGGARYWALAKYKEAMDFAGDVVRPYLLLSSAVDGSQATVAQHTSVRVVCNNTLQMSLGSDAASVKVSHRQHVDMAAIKAELNVGEAIANFAEDVEALINKALSRKQAAEALVDVFATKDKKGNVTNEKLVKRVVMDILRDSESSRGSNLETTKGTAWGIMNGATHYIDYNARSRSNANRFDSSQFGRGAATKKKIFDALMAA